MKALVTVFAVLSLLAAALGIASFWMLVGEQKSAPQEAAISAMILAAVIPPYIVARCMEMMHNVKGEGAAQSVEASKSEAPL